MKDTAYINQNIGISVEKLEGEFICRFLSNGIITFVNDAYCEHLGLKKEQLTGSKFIDMIPSEEQDEINKSVLETMADNVIVQTEHRVILPNGSTRWHQWTNMLVREQSNHIREFHAIGRDITSFKLSEKTLSQKDSLLQAIMQSSPAGYLIVDSRSDDIILFNKQFCKIWNIQHLEEKMRTGELKNSDIMLEILALVVNKSEFTQSANALQDENNRDTTDDEILLSSQKIIRRFSCQTRDEEDNYIGRMYIFEDITERKAREHELDSYRGNLEKLVKDRTCYIEKINKQLIQEIRDKENAYRVLNKYKILAENARDIILFIRLDGKIIEANEAAVNSYGYTRSELLDMAIYDLSQIELEKQSKVQIDRISENGICFESIHKRKDGTTFHVHVNTQATEISGERVLLSIIRDINENKLMEKRLIYTAKHDNLTNIPNRYYLEEFLRKIHNNKEFMESALLVLDLDNFKIVNDSYGHEVGDSLLISVANFIKSKLCKDDFLARFGGDEFAIIHKYIDEDSLEYFTQKLLEDINQETFYINEHKIPIRVTVSIGVALLDDTLEVNRLFSYVDAALYEAKEKGKNQAVTLNDSNNKTKVWKNNRILELINNALKNDRFILHLQPIYKTDNKILHQEILIRMLDENNEIISPYIFVPVAERYGLMPSIDRWVVRNSLNMLTRIHDLSIFINLSGSSLNDDLFLEWIDQSIKESEINPSRIGFEITETAAIKDLEKAERWICKLQAIGCCFALDDFGVGFSSFSYLSILPVNYLKIDGSFVRNLDADPKKVALVQAMNAVAHTLGKQTIAEFVENEAIWKIINDLGIDCGQGYYLGKPKPI